MPQPIPPFYFLRGARGGFVRVTDCDPAPAPPPVVVGTPTVAIVDPLAASPSAPVFNSFADAWDFLSARTGWRILQVLNDTTVEVRAYLGARGIQVVGLLERDVVLTVPEGVTFEKLRYLGHRLNVTFTGSTPPVSDFEFTGTAPDFIPDFFVCDLGVRVCSLGAGPFFRVVGDGTPESNLGGVLLRDCQDFGCDSMVPILRAELGAFGFVSLVGLSGLDDGTLSTDAGSGIALQFDDSANVTQDSAAFPDVLGFIAFEANAASERVRFDAGSTGLTAVNVQDALRELAGVGESFSGFRFGPLTLTAGTPVIVDPDGITTPTFNFSFYAWGSPGPVSVLEDGLYQVTYEIEISNPNVGTQEVSVELLVGAVSQVGMNVSMFVEAGSRLRVSRTAVVSAGAGDLIEPQAELLAGPDVELVQGALTIVKMRG